MQLKFFRYLLFSSLLLNFQLFSQTLITVGPGGNYTKLFQAAQALNSGGVTGPTIIELLSTYDGTTGEIFPIQFNAIPGASAVNTVTIRPAAGVTNRVTSGLVNGALIQLNGCRWLNFDGRAGGSGTIQWSLINALPQSNSNVISLSNGTQNISMQYIDIQGAGINSDNGGAIHFGQSSPGTANNANINISHCNIHNAPGQSLTTAISSNAASPFVNELITISNNNIYDFHANDQNPRGIRLAASSNRWTISGNSFYQTAPRTSALALSIIPISIASGAAGVGNEHIVTGNFIGGSQAFCGGTPYTVNTNQGTGFHAIQFSSPTANSRIIIENNTIANFNLTSSRQTNAAMVFGEVIFLGVLINGSAAVNHATISGNTFGSLTAHGSITTEYILNGGESRVAAIGIVSGSTGNHTITNNNIGGFTLNASGNRGHSFTGIWVLGANTLNIAGNQIGGNISNSIHLTSAATASTQPAHGVWAKCSGTATLQQNLVRNISNENNSTVIGTTTGIYIDNSTGAYTVGQNTISQLSSKNIANGSNVSSTVVGISFGAGSPANGNNTISQNTIHSLQNLATGTPTAGNNWVLGINYQGGSSGTQVIERNFIHSLNSSLSPDNGATGIFGMNIFTGNNLSITNNMIRLGIDANGNDITLPHRMAGIRHTAAAACNMLFNTIFIGGSNVGAGIANISACIQRNVNSGAQVIRNNALVNARSNGSGNGFHVALDMSLGTTGLSATNINHNLLRATGTGGHVGRQGTNNRTTLAQWQSNTNFDANSNSDDPAFVNATGNAASVDLHITTAVPTGVEGNGSIAGISNPPTIDFDGEIRADLSPVDIGADAGNFNQQLFPCNSAFSFVVSNCTQVLFTPEATGNNYIWNFGDGNTGELPTPNHLYANAGNYNVCLQAVGACLSSESCQMVSITIPDPININSSNGLNLCPGATTLLTASAGYDTYQWNTGATQASIATGEAGTYSVTGSTATGCSSTSAPVAIVVDAPLIGSFTALQTDNYVVSFTGNIQNAATILWNFGDGNTSSEANPMHNYAAEGIYTVSLTISNACDTLTLTETIAVIKLAVSKTAAKNNFAVFPNPCNQYVWLEFYNYSPHQNIVVEIADMHGRSVYKKNFESLEKVQINTLNWSKGIYMVRVYADGLMGTTKLIVE